MTYVLRNSNYEKYANSTNFAGCMRITHDFSSQKSVGVPFNISSYALLTHMVAHVCDLGVGDFIYTLGDYHIYQNHLEQVEELLAREPFALPKLEINDPEKKLRGLAGLLNFRYDDLSLVGYQAHAKIAAPVAV